MPATVYPTGTTIYDPEKCWNGFTVYQANLHTGADARCTVIDMNGNVINQWVGMDGFPNKALPGGYIMGSTGMRSAKYGFQDMRDLVQIDWEGNIVWRFNKYELISDPGESPQWMARQHHDYQREGNPVGYYVPGTEPLLDKGKTLILSHKNTKNTDITERTLLDDTFLEVDWQGNITWEWILSAHFTELGFDEAAKNALARNPGWRKLGIVDWMHVNSMSQLGPNRWYDCGDERFHPDNIIWDSRQSNIIAITDRKTGRLVWRLGPDYACDEKTKKLGWIIGQHHAHMIPQGLPGSGNILVFDNGGWAGYGIPNPGSPRGIDNALRDYSRVLEFNPVTLEIVWQYTPTEAGFIIPHGAHFFYSGFISGAQRLPNGNTLITEGAGGRIFEVTPEHETVWEYLSPYRSNDLKMNVVYRGYRLPYDWIPQVSRPVEKAIKKLNNNKFRVPGSPRRKAAKATKIKAIKQTVTSAQSCVISQDEV